MRAIDGLYVFEPEGDTNLFRYDVEPGEPFNVFAVARLMNERGWMMGQHRKPPAIHQPITSVHTPVLGEYLSDLEECVAIARRDRLQDTFPRRHLLVALDEGVAADHQPGRFQMPAGLLSGADHRDS